MKRSIHQVLQPESGIDGFLNFTLKLDLARVNGLTTIIVDRTGAMAEAMFDASRDRLLSLDARADNWTIWDDGLTQKQLQQFAAALLPHVKNCDQQQYAHARQLFVDSVTALGKRGFNANEALRFAVEGMPLGTVAELLAGTASAAVINERNDNAARSIRMLLADRMKGWVKDRQSTETVSVKRFAREATGGKFLFLVGDGRLGLALADMVAAELDAATSSAETAKPVVLAICDQWDDVPASLGRLMKRGGRFSGLRSVLESVTVAKTRFDETMLRYTWEYVPSARWSRVRPGWKPVRIGGCNLYPHSETTHILCVGAPGSGKSVVIKSLVEQFLAHFNGMIVYDKAGEMIREFYNPDRGDIILCPFDERSPNWSVWNDLRNVFDLEKMASAIDPLPDSGGEKFWAQNAQILFASVLQVLMSRGQLTNKAVVDAIARIPFPDLCELVVGTRAASFMNAAAEKTAVGIRSELASQLSAWEYLRDGGNQFSIVEFVKNPQGRVLFLSSRGDIHSMMKPLISLWVELVAQTLLSMGEDLTGSRRIPIILDEFASLHKLEAVGEIMAQGRKFGAAVVIGLQLVSQMNRVYGKDAAESLLGQIQTWVAMRTREASTADYLSKSYGDIRYKARNESRTMASADARDQVSYTSERKTESLLTAGDFISLPALGAYLASPEMPAVRIAVSPQYRDPPAGVDDYRDEKGYPLPFVIRRDLNIEHLLRRSRDVSTTTLAMSFVSPQQVEKMEAFSPAEFVNQATSETLRRIKRIAGGRYMEEYLDADSDGVAVELDPNQIRDAGLLSVDVDNLIVDA
ncbi:type IV secretion system DNA-binding domain-containing protein [Paraburkholderia agricolaris]|uniref:type IV secretion system DNA-binding domain-containing protein n=1 Tax=Paraburkholderia agricolaris TaxID=2152888 RepID=UPI0038BB1006